MNEAMQSSRPEAQMTTTATATMVTTTPERVGSAARFAHRAMAIVNATMAGNAARNERSLAAARAFMALAFNARLAVIYPQDLIAGRFKDWLIFSLCLAIATISMLHIWRPHGGVSFAARQRALAVLDLVGLGVALLPAVIWPESDYRGLLLLPYPGIGALVAVAGGLRLDRRLAILSSAGVFAMFFGASALDRVLNAERVAWGGAEFVYYAIELCSAAVLGIVISTRTIDLARESASAAIDGERARERLGAYIGREVAEESLRSDEIILGGVRQPVAVLFSDLRGFTSYAEKLSPEALVHELNAYLEEMVAVITAHGGVVDKYIGDGIMAVFGAPRTHPHDAARALQTARALVTALEAHNRRRGVEGRPPLKMGVGVHFGAVVAGNIGTVEHAQYTIIGDTVNLAARLEAATKDLGVPVLVSRALKDAAGETGVALVSLGSLVVRGRDEAVEIFGLPTA
jgi:adenylate cyclase